MRQLTAHCDPASRPDGAGNRQPPPIARFGLFRNRHRPRRPTGALQSRFSRSIPVWRYARSSRGAKRYQVQGRPLVCPICGERLFRLRRPLLNTPVLTWLRLDWLNRRALAFACDRCGHILWFEWR